MQTIEIESTSVETLTVRLRCVTDPTGGDVEFALGDGASDPDTWVAGTWVTDPDPRIYGEVPANVYLATTPSLGGPGALLAAAASDELYVRVGGAAVKRVCALVLN